MNRKLISSIVFVVLTLSLAACSIGSQNSTAISASGTIDVDNIRIAPELAGKIATEAVKKGDTIKAGDILFKLDDVLLQAKYEQAKAQVQQAESALELAKQNLASAQIQYQLVVDANQQQAAHPEAQSWLMDENSNIDLPNWYFEKDESISAAQAEVDASQAYLDEELASLQTVLKDASNKGFIEAENRVGLAQAAFMNADKVLDQANDGVGSEKDKLVDAAQKLYDEAKTELDAAQKAYDGMLTDTSYTDALEARARVATARARLENAQNSLTALLTRDESHQVASAKVTVDAAKANVAQVEAALAIAKASQSELEVTLGKTAVVAPVSGIVLSNPIKAGETVASGVTVYEIGSLDEVTLTVYVIEDQIGKVKIGDEANVTVDSFSGETFTGDVVYVADKAEFTPRNIQTSESRSTTVYAVEIRLNNADHKLKPGMPADAEIVISK